MSDHSKMDRRQNSPGIFHLFIQKKIDIKEIIIFIVNYVLHDQMDDFSTIEPKIENSKWLLYILIKLALEAHG